ncbi:hypothetical protein L6R52_16045 [Myxococcota bacterium]|nr:hypothetical protein [Myxococcota bacterium]
MTKAIPTFDVGSVHVARIAAARVARQTAQAAGAAESERRWDAQRDELVHRQEEMNKQIEAATIAATGTGIGALVGSIVGVAAAVAAVVVLPGVGAGLGAFLVGVGKATLGAVGAVVAGAKLGETAVSPMTTSLENDATDARTAGDQSAFDAADAKNAVAVAREEAEDARKEAKRARKVMAETRQAERNARDVKLSALAGRGGSSQISVPRGQAAAVELQHVQVLQELQDGMKLEDRLARRDAMDLRLQALEEKQDAAEEQKENATKRMFLGVLESVAQVAAAVVSGGSTVAAMAVKTASKGVALAGAATNDSAVSEAQRRAEELELSAKKSESSADDAARSKRELGERADRARDVAAQQGRAVEEEGMSIGGTPKLSLAQIQKIRAQLALDGEAESRKEERAARDEGFAKMSAAIEERRAADAAQGTAGLFKIGLAAVDLGLSAVGLADAIGAAADATSKTAGAVSDAKKLLEEAQQAIEDLRDGGVLDTLERGVAVGQAVASYAGDRAVSARRLEGEGVDLDAKRVMDRADDARSRAASDQEAARRALDAALEIQKNLAPRFA